MDDLERQRERHRVTVLALHTPNCRTCLHRMDVSSGEDAANWICIRCCGGRLLGSDLEGALGHSDT